MIAEIVQQWENNKEILREEFKKTCPASYREIVESLFKLVLTSKDYDVDKMTVIDDGDYQGTKIYIIPEKTYQPSESDYLMTAVSYGSCSGCDTLEAIKSDNYEDTPTEDQVNQFMTLALHIIQDIKPLGTP